MRIAYVGHGITSRGQGAESSIRNLLYNMEKFGSDAEFVVLSNDSDTKSPFSGTPPDHLYWLLKSTKQLAKLCKEKRIDLINIHTYGGYSSIPPKGVPTVVTPHDSPLPAFRDTISPAPIGLAIRVILELNYRLTKLAFRPDTYAIAVGTSVRNQLVGMGVDKSRIRLLPHGFTTFSRPDADIRKQDVTDELGIPRNSKLVISVGGIIYGKGIHRTVEAARILGNIHPEIHFIHVGSFVKIWSRAYYNGMRNKMNLDRIENFHLYGGLPHDYLLKMLRVSDVYLSASYTEGCSLALMEAMLESMPIVCTDVGAARDLLNDQAEIVPKDASAMDIARAVIKQIDKHRRTYPVTKSLTEEHVAIQTLEIFRDIVSRRGLQNG